MSELLQLSIEPANVLWTTLLGLVLLYWLTVIIGALDIDTLDFDFDAGGLEDPGMDLDADPGLDAAHGSSGALLAVARFLNLADLPLMVVLSVAILVMWILSILSTYYLGAAGGLVGLMLFMPCLVGGLLIAKFITAPLVPYFREAEDLAVSYHELSGKRCVVVSGEVDHRYGQIEIVTDGAPIRVNARVDEGVVLKKGDEAVIVRHDKDNDVYHVAKLSLEAQI